MPTLSRLGVIGDVVEDVVVLMRAPFAPGSDTPSRITRRRGGSAANVAVAASSLVPTRFFSCVGDDATGRRLARELGATSGNLDVALQVTTAAPTGTIVVLVDAAGERHMFPDRGANLSLRPIDDAALADVAALHATAYSLTDGDAAESVAAALTAMKERVTSLDVSSVAMIDQIGVSSLLARVDALRLTIVLANEAEAALLGWDGASPSPGRVIVVKRGPLPALVRTPLGAWHVPTTPRDVTDSTGAGDAFAAGLLAGVVSRGLTRADLMRCDEAMAVTLVSAGHRAATKWLMAREG